MAPVLNEQSPRRFAALEARALGRGGVSLMARISGLARSTIYQGLSDIRERVSAPAGRVRQGGGGRKRKTIEDPTLMADLRTMLESVTRGDPMQPLLWSSRSLRNLGGELVRKGHEVCPTTVGNLLRDMNYSLQSNLKAKAGNQHIDRNAQFEDINIQAKAFLAAREPVVGVDTKKKELVAVSCVPGGTFVRSGQMWEPPAASFALRRSAPPCDGAGPLSGREGDVRSHSSGQGEAGCCGRARAPDQGGSDPDYQRCCRLRAYYVVYAPDDTVTAIGIFDDHAGAAESNRRALAWIEQNLAPLLTEPATAVAGPVIVHTLA